MVERIACIGSGLVGQGWATLFALHGYSVILEDVSEEIVENARIRVENQMRFLYESDLAEDYEGALKRIKTSTDLRETVEHADFVQESVFESYEAKKKVFSEMDAAASPETILASSTSGLMMSEIQKAVKHSPERCIVAHPWNPSYLIPLVELCPGYLTSKETIEKTYKIMESIGKTPIILRKEVPGFIANRLSVALWREALDLVDKGIATVEDVDRAVRAGPGLRWAVMGPYLTYHLGGGVGGLEYLMRHIGPAKSEWLKTMAKWTEIPESAVGKAVRGVQDMEVVREKSFEELERWRDERLARILKILRRDLRASQAFKSDVLDQT